MTAPGTQLSGDPARVSELGNRVAQIPQIDQAKTSAGEIVNSARPCSQAVGACGAFVAAQAEAGRSIQQYLDTVSKGAESYKAIAQASANDYTTADGRGREALMQGLQERPGNLAGSPTGARDALNNPIENLYGTPGGAPMVGGPADILGR